LSFPEGKINISMPCDHSNYITNRGFLELIGIIVGHLYYFLTYTYPIDFGGSSLISTPAILYQYFPSTRSVRGFNAQPAAPRADFNQRPPPPQARRGHDWGEGNVLGGR
jgi:Derlin-1